MTSSGTAPYRARPAPLEFSTERQKPVRLALAQINTVVGDLDGNRARILERVDEARSRGADLVLFPELAVTGYPPEDLLLRPAFLRAAERSLHEIARECRGIAALVGTPHFDRDLYNACAVCVGGEMRALYRKRFLPELRRLRRGALLRAGRDLVLLEHGEVLVGPTICEDIWQPGPPATDLALAGAQLAREHLGVAVPRRQGARARGDAEDARARQRLLHRLLQRGRRPGRADLRRALAGAGRRGRGARAGARVRGVPARRRRRPDDRGRAAPARRAPPVAGRESSTRRTCRSCTSAPPRQPERPRIRRRRSCRWTASWSRCGSRWSSGSPTTCARTASATSSWACRAGSTRR